jgi:prepilin-type processing-associated H-X9-DG protein
MELRRKNPAEAYTLIEHLVVVVVLAVLAVIFMPTLNRPRRGCCRMYCVNNLKQVGLAFRCWALDINDSFPMRVSVTNGGTMELVASGFVFPHFQVMSNELNTPGILLCPQEAPGARLSANTFAGAIDGGDTKPWLGPFTGDSNVSYFIGVDATDTRPSMVLCGDRNLAFGRVPATHGLHSVWTNSTVGWINIRPRHGNGGNIGLADGSVQQVDDHRLQVLLRETGEATNRLAFP